MDAKSEIFLYPLCTTHKEKGPCLKPRPNKEEGAIGAQICGQDEFWARSQALGLGLGDCHPTAPNAPLLRTLWPLLGCIRDVLEGLGDSGCFNWILPALAA